MSKFINPFTDWGFKHIFSKNYGSRSKKGEILRFELTHNALNRKPRK